MRQLKKTPHPPNCAVKKCRQEADVLVDGGVSLCMEHWCGWFIPLMRSHNKVARARRYQLTLSKQFTTRRGEKTPPPVPIGVTLPRKSIEY